VSRRKEKEAAEELPEERGPLAGGCVLVALGGGTTAGVFAASPTVGTLAVWGVGAVVLWRTVRRKGTDLPLPSPTVPPSRGDVFAGESGEVARVVRVAEGVRIIHPVRTEVKH
jgi:hypothetical protein